MRGAAVLLALALPTGGAAGQAASAAGPPPGRYQASLCVTTALAAAPSCGEALLEIRAGDRLSVSVADIVYRLHVQPGRLVVQTMHGAMQIDEFSAAYAWSDGALGFVDAEKAVRYQVRPGARLNAR